MDILYQFILPFLNDLYLAIMPSTHYLFLALLQAGRIVAQACPEIPDTGVTIGDPVPIRPDHVPQGCSDFEILVGK
jgi:hypothetical protein